MTLLPFIKKETLHVLRDVRMMLIAVLIPVVQMLLFGFAISTEVNDVRVAVAFEKHSSFVQKSVARLEGNPYITLVGQIPLGTQDAVLRRAEADAVVVFNRHDAVQIILDASNPNTAQSAAMYLSSILTSPSEAARKPLISPHYLYNPQLLSAYNFAPAIMGMIFLLICSLMTAVSIVREKETGTMEVLLVSPVRPLKIIVSKMVPFLILSCLDLMFILVIAKYVLAVPMASGVAPIVVVSLLYIVLALALGLFVSTLARTQVAAMLISGMVMIIPVVMLSGMLFPIENLPPVLKEISAVVPARWYIAAMRKLMIMGLSWREVLLECGVLLGMTLLLLVVALKNFKDRLE